jgi:hypothetical protein
MLRLLTEVLLVVEAQALVVKVVVEQVRVVVVLLS